MKNLTCIYLFLYSLVMGFLVKVMALFLIQFLRVLHATPLQHGVDGTSNLTSQDLEQVNSLNLTPDTLSNLADLRQLPNLQYLY